jgi:hypothetical protein
MTGLTKFESRLARGGGFLIGWFGMLGSHSINIPHVKWNELRFPTILYTKR